MGKVLLTMHHRMRRRVLSLPLLVVVVFTATGCPPQPPALQGPAEADRPTLREAADRFNANIARLDRLWATTVVELRWKEKDGKKRFEQGDGNLVMRLPNDVAFSVGKLGNVMLWAGADAERYWLFDLTGDQRTVFFGRHDKAERGEARDLGLPVRPRDLPQLLAVTPIKVDDARAAEHVGWQDGAYVIDLPTTHARLYLRPDTYLPTRVELIDVDGKVWLVCRLSKHERVELVKAPPGAWPRVATRVEADVVGQDAKMTLFLADMTNDPDRIHDRAFDMDTLIKALKVDRQVNLDEK
jgi:hypothetical protein